jgi:hypothetical protein
MVGVEPGHDGHRLLNGDGDRKWGGRGSVRAFLLMITRWQDVRCASISVEDLTVLADLRREAGIRVTIAEGRAWVCWDDGPNSEGTRRVLVERLLPLAGVETFLRRDGRWHRPGEHLPAFGMPIGDGSSGAALDRVIVPEPLSILRPEGDAPRAVPLRLVRDTSRCGRPTAAVRCRLGYLAEWAERVPSTWIESLSGAWCAAVDGDPDRADVLVLGPADLEPWTEPLPPRAIHSRLAHAESPSPQPSPRRGEGELHGLLPAGEKVPEGRMRGGRSVRVQNSTDRSSTTLRAPGPPRPPGLACLSAPEDGERFWGRTVLIPLGYRTEPELPDRALRDAVGAQADDLVVLAADSAELVPRQAFRPLSRASIRLARMARTAGPATGGGPS